MMLREMKLTGMILTVAAVFVFGIAVVYANSLSSDAKFISRIEKKQEALTSISQDAEGLSETFESHISNNRYTDNEKEAVLSDSKWVTRLEHKLGAMVNDSMKDMECMKHSAMGPVMNGNLVPESQFQDKKEGIKTETEKK